MTLHIIVVSVQMDADLNTPLVFNRCCNSQYSKISTEKYSFAELVEQIIWAIAFHDIPLKGRCIVSIVDTHYRGYPISGYWYQSFRGYSL